jgi:RND family efflux transporter MFP subunit
MTQNKSFKTKIIIGISIFIIIILIILGINKYRMISKSAEEKFSALPVTVSEVKKQIVTENLTIIGTVLPDNEVTVVSETQGEVLDIKVKVGTPVSKETIIAYIDDELLSAAFITAKTAYEKAAKDFERATTLHKQQYLSDSDFENARLNSKNAEAQFIAARKRYNDTKIKSPIKGIVTDKYINIGGMVAPGTPVATIVDISKMKVKVSIQENDVFKVKAGDKVKIISDLFPDKKYEGKIESISEKADYSHAFPVEISMVNDPDNPLKAGMSVKIDFNFIGSKKINLIPRIALVGSIKNPQVFVVEGKVAKLKEISAGEEYGTDIEVISGLDENAKVVVSGQNNLSDNVEVSIQSK